MSLNIDISNYKQFDSVHLKKMKEFYETLDIETAIEYASTGKNYNGKMNPHQWRVGYKKGMLGAVGLKIKLREINNCMDFQAIFNLTEKVKSDINGLGDLWCYDTALRIGFNLKKYPRKVYVQRGVVKGVKKVLNGERPRGRSLAISVFPKELHLLKTYEIENFLCIYGKDNKKVYTK